MKGHLHPITILQNKIIRYFDNYGFEVVYGNEIVSEEENFDLLNIPKNHPARDLQDTFYTLDSKVLRTHTSAMQVPVVREKVAKKELPCRLLFPGLVYRNEATDATHLYNFNQIEGLIVEKDVSLAKLVYLLEGLFVELFDLQVELRIRPSYFPFVEPGIELDMKGKDGWIELLGAGVVHPRVIQNFGLDPNVWQGVALGIGLERVLSLLTNLKDIRTVFSGDYRYLGQN